LKKYVIMRKSWKRFERFRVVTAGAGWKERRFEKAWNQIEKLPGLLLFGGTGGGPNLEPRESCGGIKSFPLIGRKTGRRTGKTFRRNANRVFVTL